MRRASMPVDGLPFGGREATDEQNKSGFRFSSFFQNLEKHIKIYFPDVQFWNSVIFLVAGQGHGGGAWAGHARDPGMLGGGAC